MEAMLIFGLLGGIVIGCLVWGCINDGVDAVTNIASRRARDREREHEWHEQEADFLRRIAESQERKAAK